MYQKILKEIIFHKNKKKAKILSRFFKTDKGQYGEGDLFLGIIVPISRKIARKYSNISFSDISKLIKNKYHEVRLIAILILVYKYKITCVKQDLIQVQKIYNFYLKYIKYINNWDLVDLSAHHIVGNYLNIIEENQKKKKKLSIKIKSVLEKFAKSKNLWKRRIAIVSTYAFIYKGESKWTFYVIKILLKDKHDLIHKACGWMLREIGKRISKAQLISFLDVYASKMPRTMLRYAIEHLPKKKRKYYLNKK